MQFSKLYGPTELTDEGSSIVSSLVQFAKVLAPNFLIKLLNTISFGFKTARKFGAVNSYIPSKITLSGLMSIYCKSLSELIVKTRLVVLVSESSS